MSRNRAGRSERLRGAPYHESAPTFRPGLEARSGPIAAYRLHSKTPVRSPAFGGICPVAAALADGIWLNSYDFLENRCPSFSIR